MFNFTLEGERLSMATPISNHFPTHRQYHLILIFVFCFLFFVFCPFFYFVLCCILLSAVYFALCIMCVHCVMYHWKQLKKKKKKKKGIPANVDAIVSASGLVWRSLTPPSNIREGVRNRYHHRLVRAATIVAAQSDFRV